jgi:hypothetical protein
VSMRFTACSLSQNNVQYYVAELPACAYMFLAQPDWFNAADGDEVWGTHPTCYATTASLLTDNVRYTYTARTFRLGRGSIGIRTYAHASMH